MDRAIRMSCVLAVAVAASGCIGYERSSTNPFTSPTPIGTQGLLGTWVSSSTVITPESCNGFQWFVTSRTATAASGSFSATCANGLRLAGTATGTLLGTSTIGWEATGTATGSGQANCPFALTATAAIEGSRIRVPYSGTTCLGPVSGTELLRRQ
jgi:hypothetical protein